MHHHAEGQSCLLNTQQGLAEFNVSGTADGEELGQSLDDAQEYGLPQFHQAAVSSDGNRFRML